MIFINLEKYETVVFWNKKMIQF